MPIDYSQAFQNVGNKPQNDQQPKQEDNNIVNHFSNPSIPDEQKKAGAHAILGQLGQTIGTIGDFLDKGITKVMDPASKFLYGSTSKTVGSTIVGLVKDIQGKTKEAEKVRSENQKPLDIAFTALELWPGGGELGKLLKKLPGGEQVAKYITETVPEAMKASAIAKYTSAFRPTSKASKSLAEKTVPKLLEKGKVITSMEKLGEESAGKISQFGKAIGKFIEKLPEDVKTITYPALEKLELMKQNYIIKGKIIDQAKHDAITSVQERIGQLGTFGLTKDIQKFRKVLDESVNESGGFIIDKATKFTAKVEKAAADSFRNELAQQFPELDKINKQFNFWSNVKDLVKYTSGKSKGSITSTGAAAVGAIEGLVTKAGAAKTLGTAYLFKKAADIFKSPMWKTISAVQKNKLADYLAKGNFKLAETVINRIAISIKNLSDSSSQPDENVVPITDYSKAFDNQK